MKDHSEAVRRFFAAYEKRFNDAMADPPVVDTEGMRASFARYFVGASPRGVMGGKNGLFFRFVIPRGFAHYRKVGTTLMKVAGIEVTALDDLHVMARVAWHSEYRKDGRDIAIDFENIYLLQIADEGPKIFAYVTGDEEKVMKEHGLL